MNDKVTLKFRKHETFYIRDGWFEKAINAINESSDENIFSKNKGGLVLGIGTNMAKALRYWLQAASVIKTSATKTALDDLGQLLLTHDPFLESTFSWFVIHYMLCSNYEECPIFFAFFNSSIRSIKRTDIPQYLKTVFEQAGQQVKLQSIEEDTTIFLKSYLGDDPAESPEDNYNCPLSQLGLLSKKGEKIEKQRPKFSRLSHLIVYYALAKISNYEPFSIEDLFGKDGSPVFIFNLDKNSLLQYLEEMKKDSLITINKTAGLNTVYFEKKLTLKNIFELNFGGQNDVL